MLITEMANLEEPDFGEKFMHSILATLSLSVTEISKQKCQVGCWTYGSETQGECLRWRYKFINQIKL